jgi:hypothetical protein
MAQVVNGTQLEYPHHLGWLYRHSSKLRQQAVECLRQKRKVLFLQGNEYLRSHDLVQAAAAQYGITAEEYCNLMQQDSYWGGGPEIVALCNVLKRPIHVYELATTSVRRSSSSSSLRMTRGIGSGSGKSFVLRRMACFGSPKFDKKEPFHILSADSRFPDLAPGRQLASGNHFLAIFPIPEHQDALNKWLKEQKKQRKKQKKRKQGVRGGDCASPSLFTQQQQQQQGLPTAELNDQEEDDQELYSRLTSDEDSSVKGYLWKLCKRILFLDYSD